jgi:hypothetical protein
MATAHNAAIVPCAHHRNIDIVKGFSTFSATLLAFTFIFGNSVKVRGGVPAIANVPTSHLAQPASKPVDQEEHKNMHH